MQAESYLELCRQARQQLLDGRPGDAAALARRALGLLPRGTAAQRLLGLSMLELGEPRPALHAFAGALSSDPLDAVSCAGTAEAHEHIAGRAEAEDHWRRAWEVDPHIPEVEARYVAARRAAGALDTGSGPPLTRAALTRIYLAGELHEHAAVEARALLARDPDRAEVQVTLAEAYWRMGDAEAAAGVAASLLERLPDCAAANLLLAAYWQMTGRDISAPMSRVRAVDPAGEVASRLFAGAEPPPLMEAEAAAAPWHAAQDSAIVLTVPPLGQAPVLPEPHASIPEAVRSPAEGAPEPGEDERAADGHAGDERAGEVARPDLDEMVSSAASAVQAHGEAMEEPETAAEPEPDAAREPERESEPEREPEPEPEPEPERQEEPEPEPEAPPAVAMAAAGGGAAAEQPPVASDAEQEVQEEAEVALDAAGVVALVPPASAVADENGMAPGDAAMRARRYLEAIRLYGAALRQQRPAGQAQKDASDT